MKEKLTRNIGLKILSIILAVILWLVITNVDDPVKTKNFYNVPVEILNVDAIASLNQVYDIIEGETINFTVAARRSIKDNLTSSDFKVTADFSKLSDVNAVAINISCPRYGDKVVVTDGLYQVMKISLEDLAEKHFKVNVVQKGVPAKGYYVSEKTANTIIRVSGPISKIESISQIVVEVDVTEEAGTYRTTEQPKALDKDGKEIDSSNLEFSDKTVTINIGMYKTKTIDLLITTSGKPADGYIMTAVDYEPKTIVIAGDNEALSKIQSLSAQEDIDGAAQDIKKEINLQEQLQEGLILIDENQTAVINIKIEKAKTKELTLKPEDINYKNKPEGLDIGFLTNAPIVIKVTGPESVIKDLMVKNLKPYIDLSKCSIGTYNIRLKIDAGEYISLSNTPSVNVYLHK